MTVFEHRVSSVKFTYKSFYTALILLVSGCAPYPHTVALRPALKVTIQKSLTDSIFIARRDNNGVCIDPDIRFAVNDTILSFEKLTDRLFWVVLVPNDPIHSYSICGKLGLKHQLLYRHRQFGYADFNKTERILCNSKTAHSVALMNGLNDSTKELCIKESSGQNLQ